MTAATPLLRRLYLEDALVSTARAQRDPTPEHRALATRRTQRLRDAGGSAAVTGADRERAMAGATATVALDEMADGCFCGQCGRAAA